MRGDAGTEGSQGQERELLPGRRDRALAPAVVETCATGTSARKARRIAERMGVGRLSKDQAGAIARSLDADAAEPLGRDLSGYRISNPKSFGAQTRNSEAIKHAFPRPREVTMIEKTMSAATMAEEGLAATCGGIVGDFLAHRGYKVRPADG